MFVSLKGPGKCAKPTQNRVASLVVVRKSTSVIFSIEYLRDMHNLLVDPETKASTWYWIPAFREHMWLQSKVWQSWRSENRQCFL